MVDSRFVTQAPAAAGAEHAAPPRREAEPALVAAAFTPAARLQPRDVLALQRGVGNRAVLRLLPTGKAATLRRQQEPPAATPEAPAPAEAEAPDPELTRRLTQARDGIIDAMGRDGAALMTRLNMLDDDLREPLFTDATLRDAIQRNFTGLTRFIVKVRLRHGSHQLSYERQFSRAVRERDFSLLRDLLRSYSPLRSPELGVEDVLTSELAGAAELPELLRLVRESALQQGRVFETDTSARYHAGEPGSPPELRQHLGRSNYQLVRTASELRVIIRIRFVSDLPNAAGRQQNYYPADAKLRDWRNGIERYWNNRFTATNGTTSLRLVFVPMFNAEEVPHRIIRIIESSGVSSVGLDGGTWYTGADGTVIAHEFGHLIGNPDEYDLPARPEDIPPEWQFSEEEKRRSSYESLTGRSAPHPGAMGNTVTGSIMGDYGPVHQRHVGPILEHFNTDLKPADEPPFQLVGGVP